MNWINNNTSISIQTEGGYTLEQILDNKHCSKDPKYWIPIKGSDRYLFKSDIAESWEFLDPRIKNPISNTNQIYLRFLNTSVFTEARDAFNLHGYYCPAPEDTIAFNQFWDEQEDLVEQGAEVGGIRITGRYYFWLNFGRLKATDKDTNRKIEMLPGFVDHQYYWSLELEECGLEGPYNNKEYYLNYFPNKLEIDFKRLRKEGMVVAKGRRKGYSYYKASALHVYNFTWLEDSKNILAAFEKGHYETPLSAIHMCINFLNKSTPWIRRRGKIDRRDHFKASIETTDEFGIKIEEGYKSEVLCLSFMDDPFKGIGDSADYVDIEEAGKFVRLLETYEVSVEPVIRDGDIMIGIPLIGGTAGDMDKGSVDLYKMHSDPRSYRLKGYGNIYDNRPSDIVGWFIDDMWYLPGFIEKETIKKLFPKDEYLLNLLDKYEGEFIETVDEQGNSHRRFAEIIIDEKRKIKIKGDRRAYDKSVSQQPKTLSECFLITEGSPFDVALVKEVLSELKTDSKSSMEWGDFTIDSSGKVQWRNDMSKQYIAEYPLSSKDMNTEGCWVIYEKPKIKEGEELSHWRFCGSCDPIDFGSEETGTNNSHSLASTFIIDTLTRTIVAEYTGRPTVSEKYYEQLWRGLEYYRAELLYENNLKGLFSYFRNKNKLHLLANEPECLKDRYGYKSNNRVKGFHATKPINGWGRELLNEWSLEEHVIGQNQETGEVQTVPKMYTIKSIPLLQEMQGWNSKGNFDRISSMGALMILLNDRQLHLENINSSIKDRFKGDKLFSAMKNIGNKKQQYKEQLFLNI